MDTSVDRLRADTPGCANVTHLNNAGASLMPNVVLRAAIDHLELEALTGGYEAADDKAAEIESVYSTVGRLIQAPPRNIAIVANATAGFIQAMSSFDFAPGDVIVTTRCDYVSYQIQYLALRERLGVLIVHADDLPEGGVDPDSVRALADNAKCRLVHVTWVPTNSGLVQDVEAVGDVCEDLGVPYLVDACQAVGQLPIDVARLKCDYLSATARKFMRGPRGIGFLYASDRALARGDHPLFVDMRGAEWIDKQQYRVVDTAQRYEDWEFPYALVLGLGAAARYALDVGIGWSSERARMLARTLRSRLSELPGVRTLDRGRNPSAIVTADLGRDATDVVRLLRERRINTTASLRWYGIYDFDDKGVTSAIRISPHYYNTEAEIDFVIDALTEILQ